MDYIGQMNRVANSLLIRFTLPDIITWIYDWRKKRDDWCCFDK